MLLKSLNVIGYHGIKSKFSKKKGIQRSSEAESFHTGRNWHFVFFMVFVSVLLQIF